MAGEVQTIVENCELLVEFGLAMVQLAFLRILLLKG